MLISLKLFLKQINNLLYNKKEEFIMDNNNTLQEMEDFLSYLGSNAIYDSATSTLTINKEDEDMTDSNGSFVFNSSNINTNSGSNIFTTNNGTWNQPYTISTNNAYSNWNFNTNFQLDSDDLAINIEKLFEYSAEKRDVLKEIIKNFINETDHNVKKMLLNTLESYGLITDKKSLERKVKISNIIEEEK